MKPRLNSARAAPGAMRALAALDTYVRQSGIEPNLIELVKTRASQINGCAYCLHMHTRDARAKGESEERLYVLAAWRESPLYTERERAALAWTEAVTLVSQSGVPRRRLRRGQPTFLQNRTGEPDRRGCRDQRVEPYCNQLPRCASGQSNTCSPSVTGLRTIQSFVRCVLQ